MTSREQLQALIRAEIDRQRPVAVARRTLELLVESATRRLDAPPGYQIVDRDGRPRTRAIAGEAVPLTLGDLVDELRRQHPTMFQPPAAPAAAPAPPPVEAPRDWIVVKPASPPPPPAGPDRAARLREALGGLAARLRRPPREQAAPAAAPVPPVAAPPPGEGLKPGLARPRPLPARNTARRPLVAVLGSLALLGIGYAALRGGEPAPREAAVAQATGQGASQGGAGKPADARTAEANPTDRKSAEGKPASGPGETKAPEAKREPVETGAVAPEAAGPVAGVAEVLDTATLRLGGRTLRLYGVETAKGAQASDLSGYLGGRPVNCQPSPAKTAWICTVDGHDLSEVVLYNGGGRATAEATPDLVEAERHARSGKLGIWGKP
ncbi:thermonuclease family protein [Methylobacterium tarhaniae]|uniref:thermonuclease family protein n=1 Tax=Methylobacterium tarhaniae TaxID=1187852 RepID=UPI003CFC4E12